MIHEEAFTRLPDLLGGRDDPALVAHVAACHRCQRQLFLLGRVDRLLRDTAHARRRERRHTRAGRWLGLAAGLGAAVALLVLFLPREDTSRHFTLRTGSGQPIGGAVLKRADAENTALSLVARGLPTDRGDMYVLWAAAADAPATSVGRFMVDPRGACRARFNLPGRRNWTRLWVTLPGEPKTIVAQSWA